MGGYWAVYTIKAGRMVERYKVWKSGSPRGPRRKRVKGSSTLKKLEANMAGAIRRLARVLNANFTRSDIFLKLDYDDAHLPADWEQHEADRAWIVERLKKKLKKAGATCVKVVSEASDKDGKTGEQERRHIHIIISGDGIVWRDGAWWIRSEQVKDIWGKGGCHAEALYDQPDYTGLAVYLIRQARSDKADWQKYHTSRNLIRPVPEEETAKTDRQLKAPRGAVVAEVKYNQGVYGANYIRYVAPPRKDRKERCPGSASGGKECGTDGHRNRESGAGRGG